MFNVSSLNPGLPVRICVFLSCSHFPHPPTIYNAPSFDDLLRVWKLDIQAH